MKEKGIEEAINTVMAINLSYQELVFRLDIYGPVEETYRQSFSRLEKQLPDYIVYKGIVEPDQSVETLKNYDLLLFPTTYEGEGFAGTILDAFASGLPVIATDWHYNGEIISDHSDGLIYDYRDANGLRDALLEILDNEEMILSMKKNCLKRAQHYQPSVVIGKLIKNL
jgi:glycosyltransferase involved in cell wall biosynthesis